jgi:hypothetical protein
LGLPWMLRSMCPTAGGFAAWSTVLATDHFTRKLNETKFTIFLGGRPSRSRPAQRKPALAPRPRARPRARPRETGEAGEAGGVHRFPCCLGTCAITKRGPVPAPAPRLPPRSPPER